MADTEMGFCILVPPGWARLPAGLQERSRLKELVADIVLQALPDHLPRDRAQPWRSELQKRLMNSVVAAGEAGASAVYMPVVATSGRVAPASIIESVVDAEEDGDASMLASEILANPEWKSQPVILDGASAIRSENFAPLHPLDGDWEEVPTRQIVYFCEVPRRPGKWIVLSFSAAAGGATSTDLGDALVMLFDALMSTFRWLRPESSSLRESALAQP